MIALQRIAAPESLEALLRKLMVVSETPLRDALLLALGVVIDLHPDPVPVAIGVQRRDRAGSVAQPAGLSGGDPRLGRRIHLAGRSGEQTRDHASLLRAATAVTVVAGLRSLYPPVLSRIAIDEDPAWAVGLFQRHPGALSPALRELLRHADLRVRRGALLAGAFAPEDFTLVVEHLKDPDDLVRAAACRALGVIGDPRAAPLLVQRLSGGEPSEQAAAIAALAEFPPEALQMLEGCLGADVPEPVVVAALGVLGRRAVPRFEQRIAELSRHPSPAIRRGAIKAAAQLPGSKAEVILIRGLADRHQPNQVEALDLLVQRDQGKTVPTLAALLQADDSFRST